MGKPLITEDAARHFLSEHHGGEIAEFKRIAGGYWSSAFGYSFDGEPLVARFGNDREWYEVDQAAYAFNGPQLPVPRVRTIGEAFDGLVFAISERAEGVYWEDSAGAGLEALVRSVLGGLRSVPEADVDYTWRQWLLAGIDHEGRNAENRTRVARDPMAGPVADRTEREVRSLLEACPERRELIHGDLVHKNVLVTPDLSQVTAVYSWKCSARGDSLFDAAWLSLWGPWFPGMGAIDMWAIANDGSADVATRFRCYRLHIGLTHLCWYAYTDDPENLHRMARRLEELLGD